MIAAFIGVAVAVFIVDFVWTELVIAVQEKRAMLASMLAAVFYGLYGVAIVAFVQAPWLIVAGLIGAFGGTYASIRFPCAFLRGKQR